MITLTILFLATFFLAYSNGANDNFKGVFHALRQQHHELQVRHHVGHNFDVCGIDHVALSCRDAAQDFFGLVWSPTGSQLRRSLF